MKVHNDGPECSGCNKKLEQVHPKLVEWFKWLKTQEPSVHVSEGWRGPEKQNEYFRKGLSKRKYPDSKHNKADETGKPQSLAVDIFQIDADGEARFSQPFYLKVWTITQQEGFKGMRWLGEVKGKSGFIDGPHFELI